MKTSKLLLWILLTVSLIGFGQLGRAEEVNISGELISKIELSLDPDSDFEILQYQNIFELEVSKYAFNSGQVRTRLRIIDQNMTNIQLTEALAELYLDSMDIYVGKQKIVWGSALGVNPTSYFNPIDYSILLDEDNQIEVPATRIKYYYEDWVIEGVWVPVFTSAKFPQPGSKWYLPQNDFSLLNVVIPECKLKNSEAGLRVSRWFGLFEASVNYYTGWERIPTINIVEGKAEFNRLQAVGFDFTTELGKMVVWTEGAYFIPDTGETDGRNNFQYVLGTDFRPMQDLYINVQLIGEKDQEFVGPDSIALSTEYNINAFNNLELNVIYNIEDKDYCLNPRYSSQLMDGVSLSLGAYFLGGEEDTRFGAFSKKDYLLIELVKKF